MVTSMPTVQTHARLQANSVSHSPPVSGKVKEKADVTLKCKVSWMLLLHPALEEKLFKKKTDEERDLTGEHCDVVHKNPMK
uniref:Uncharacterized protein n=1 Tax=Tanacetum cinerariifolium TaxID=118510 RepID=A0A699K9N1_TANCI|nr:hypothetical protein [Tanacetum cinerariifolium]